MSRDSRGTSQPVVTACTLAQLQRTLAAINSRIEGLGNLIARNSTTPSSGPQEDAGRQRVIRRHETCLLERVRIQARITQAENSRAMAFALAFLETARSHASAGEFDRLTAITRNHIEQELCA